MKKIIVLLILLVLLSCAFSRKNPQENQEIDGIIYLKDDDDETKPKSKSAQQSSDRQSSNKTQPENPKDQRPLKNMDGITYLDYEDQAREVPGEKLTPSKNFETGKASYYAMELKGRKTASGDLYDPNKLTAAHPTLPFGTMVKVTNLFTNESVVVRINDRGPHIKSRIIDLSYAAAQKIGLVKQGIANVAIEVVKNP